MFAAMGSINLFAAPTRGMALGFFSPARMGTGTNPAPAPAPDPVNLMNAARACACDYLLCVPAFLEIWARDEETVKVMKGMDGFVRVPFPILLSSSHKIYLTFPFLRPFPFSLLA